MAATMAEPLSVSASALASGFYMQYLESLCRRRGWLDPTYECRRDVDGYSCLVLVNGREYQTDLAYESDVLAQENAAMRAFMVCRNFSVNGGMLARNGIVQGLPANDSPSPARPGRKARHSSTGHGGGGHHHHHHNHTPPHHHQHRERDRAGDGGHSGRYDHSSSSSTASFEE